VLASDVAVEIGDHSLRLPRGDAPTRRGLPFVRDPLGFFPIYLFCAPLNAPSVGESEAGKPKFRAFPLPDACHTDNDTDNIQ
jgi:hypothetical protein